MKTFLILSFWIICISFHPCTVNCQTYPFRNVSLTWEERVEDLVWRLTLEEMVEQMAFGGAGSFKPSPGIERLGIQPYNFYTVCFRGIRDMPATAFPQNIGMAASFSPDLIRQIASATAIEARAFYNQAKKIGLYKNNMGVSCLAPFINLVRHPLWGRIKEVYGEDPFLSGTLAASFVKGMQGNDKNYRTASSGCLTIDAYSGPENIPSSRLSFNAVVSERDLRLTYLQNFKLCIEADPLTLMCSYNSINGIPACASKWLMQDIIRDEYGFNGYIISDRGAVEYIYSEHKYASNYTAAAVDAIKAGVNMDLPLDPHPSFLLLTDAVKKGLLTFETIVERVKPLFYTRMRLGEFDPEEMNPYNKIGLDQVLSEDHRELATVSATKTFVLLKNINNILPFIKKIESMAIVGPMSDNLAELYSSYTPLVLPEYGYTPYTGLRDMADKVFHASGCKDNLCKQYNQTSVVSAVKGSDVIIVCLGTGALIEGESLDRSDMNLPVNQTQLLKDVLQYGAGRPIILLLFTGGPVDISFAKYSPDVSAIIQCFFPAMSTGLALARVLFTNSGAQVVSPAGRLPYTWYSNLEQVPSMTDYSMEGRTYRYFKGPGEPLYPFGYGLSYTKFKYTNLSLSTTQLKPDTPLFVQCAVHNNGTYDSDEVIQIYISWLDVTVPMPKIQLVAISRTMIAKGKFVLIQFTISSDKLLVWDDDTHKFIFQPGRVQVYCGGQQPNQSTTVPSNILSTTLHLSK